MMQKKKKKRNTDTGTEWPSAGGEAAVPEQGWMMDGSSLNGEWQACSQCVSEHLDGDWVGLVVGVEGVVGECYLHVGKGATQGRGAGGGEAHSPPLLLQGPGQLFKLHLLLPD